MESKEFLNQLFVAIDGDDVGSRIELFILDNQITELRTYSERFNKSVDWLIDIFVERFAATVYLKGGDSIFIGTSRISELETVIEDLRQQFAQQSGNTLSMGIGSTPLEAYLSLKYAKASGKNKISRYSSLYS